jgi:hypothetical protein
LIFLTLGSLNLQLDWLNIVRAETLKRYSRAEVLFSRSSFVGRYDVIRREPSSKSLKTYENGRVIDTMRQNPKEDYQIDPRLPHTLIQDPTILILGLSGDGIAKTAKSLGKKVDGVEVNPAIVRLQTNELVRFNGHSYKDLAVAVMDGRSFLQQSSQTYDMITLMNAHFARGRTTGRAPSPEYLHTREAIILYLQHLTDRGVLIVEDPVSQPTRELPVWKLLVTMQQALLDYGHTQPQQHFFVFQWKTRQNNYVQILMKKTPFTAEDIRNLKQWLREVDNIKHLEARRGQRLGPIRAKTTLLYTPNEPLATNYARILRQEVDPDFLRARNLRVSTDNQPFLFDVDPKHPKIKESYYRTLILVSLLLPFFLSFLAHQRSE